MIQRDLIFFGLFLLCPLRFSQLELSCQHAERKGDAERFEHRSRGYSRAVDGDRRALL